MTALLAHEPAGVSIASASPTEAAAAWSANADPLAKWTIRRLVNRRDRHAAYIALEKRRVGENGKARSPVYTSGRLTRRIIVRHFAGVSTGHVVGLHSTQRDKTGDCWSRWVVVDIDQHGDADGSEANWRYVVVLYERLRGLGLKPLLIDSNGRGGYHIWVIFGKPVPTRHAYALGKWLVQDHEAFGFPGPPETFPKSPSIDEGKCGSLVRVPGMHHTRPHWSRIWDGAGWLDGEAAVRHLLGVKGVPGRLIPTEALTCDSAMVTATKQTKKPPANKKSKTDQSLEAKRLEKADIERKPKVVRARRSFCEDGRVGSKPFVPESGRPGDFKALLEMVNRKFPITGQGQRYNQGVKAVGALVRQGCPDGLVLQVMLAWWAGAHAKGLTGTGDGEAEEDLLACIEYTRHNPEFAPAELRHEDARSRIALPDDLWSLLKPRTEFKPLPGRGDCHPEIAIGPRKGAAKKGEGENSKRGRIIQDLLCDRPLCVDGDDRAVVDALLVHLIYKRLYVNEPLEWTNAQIRRTAFLRHGVVWGKRKVRRMLARYVTAPGKPASRFELFERTRTGHRRSGKLDELAEWSGVPSLYLATNAELLLPSRSECEAVAVAETPAAAETSSDGGLEEVA